MEEHGGHRQHVAGGTDRDEALLGADHDLGDRHLAGLLHGLEQESVGLLGARARDEVVGVVVEDRVDVRLLDEVEDVDGAGLLGIQPLELGRLDHDVAVG